MQERVAAPPASGAVGASRRGTTSCCGDAALPAEGRATQKPPCGEGRAQGGRPASAGDTASAAGAVVPQVSVNASPGEGPRGSENAAAPAKKGQAAVRAAGAPRRGGRETRAGVEQPSGRARQEKSGGEEEGEGERLAVGEALGVGLALGDREAVAVREGVTDIVREGERVGEGLGDTMQVGTVRQDEQEAR